MINILAIALSQSAGDMLDLLKWRTHPERIMDGLSKLKDMDGTEIVKVKRFFKTLILLQIPLKRSRFN